MLDVFGFSLADVNRGLRIGPRKAYDLVSNLTVELPKDKNGQLCRLIAVTRRVELKSDCVCWLVFSLTDGIKWRYFKKEGSSCWGDLVWDGALTEVYPETKTITVFETKKAG